MLDRVIASTPSAYAGETRLFIDGHFVAGGGDSLAVENPATEETIAVLRQVSSAQLHDAVQAAKRAFRSGVWSNGERRKAVLLRLADLLEQNQQDIGAALINEVGTPSNLIAPLQLGVPLRILRYYAELAAMDRTRQLGPDNATPLGSESIVRQLPAGVVGAIAAYNYPILLLVLKLAPALAAGCTVVALPSPQTPLATLLFARLLTEAGVPDGVVSILVGGTDIAQALTLHPDVDKITFTGSVQVGQAVMRQAAGTLKGLVLELGGKSATIVLPGADLAKIVGPVHLRYLRNAGQGCASPTRLLVPADRMDEFAALSREVFASVKVGDPWSQQTIAGPLISAPHRARVEAYVQRALADGARIVAGGGRPDRAVGYYMNPTLLAGVDNDHEICRDELFGPVGVVLPYRDVDHAIDIANDSSLGLAAAIFGPTGQAKDVAMRLRVGSVYINGGGALRVDAPMGGLKQSGIGREYGEEGLREFLEPQHIQWAV